MNRARRGSIGTLLMALMFAVPCHAFEQGIIRSLPMGTPGRGMLSVTNTSFYAPIEVNTVLSQTYGVKKPRVLSSLSRFSYGITNSIAVTATVPYFADTFTQGGDYGRKGGAGDVTVGLWMVRGKTSSAFSAGLGVSMLVPDAVGYGAEPLGFRTFSSGEQGVGVDAAFGLTSSWLDQTVSVSMRRFPNAPPVTTALKDDVFYDSGFAFLGIGQADATGRAQTIYQNQISVVYGATVPVTSWLIGAIEYRATTFSGTPTRRTLTSVAPGVVFGRPGGMRFSAGVDFGIGQGLPGHAWVLRLHIPSVSPGGLGLVPAQKDRPAPPSTIQPRSRNALVAVAPVTRSDLTFMYGSAMKNELQSALVSLGSLTVAPSRRVDTALAQSMLVPGGDTPARAGVRLGSTHIIRADVTSFTSERTARFSVPFVISLPVTVMTLHARATVTDLVTGKSRELGVIAASVEQERGVTLFPVGASSDIVQLSEPRRREMEEEVVSRWVEECTAELVRNMDAFGWTPKRSEATGDEDASGT